MLRLTNLFEQNEGGLWLAHLLSTIGERLTFITLILTSGELIGAENGTMVILTLYTATFIFASLFSGKIVDKLPTKKLIIQMDIYRSILAIIYIAILYLDLYSYLKIILISINLFFILILSTIARSAFWKLIPQVVKKKKISKFNSLITMNENLGLAIGVAIGALVTDFYGPNLIFALDSFTYLISAILIFKLSNNLKRERTFRDKIKDLSSISGQLSEKWFSSYLVLPFVLLIFTCIVSGAINVHAVSDKVMVVFTSTIDKGVLYSILALGSWCSVFLNLPTSYIFRTMQLFVIFFFGIIVISTTNITYLIFGIFICALLITNQMAAVNKELMVNTLEKYHGRVSSMLIFTVRVSLLVGIWGYKIL